MPRVQSSSTLEAQAEQAQLRARSKKYEAQRREVLEMLTQHPEAVGQVREFLLGLGAKEGAPVCVAPKAQPAKVKVEAVEGEMDRRMRPIDRRMCRFDKWSVLDLQHLLMRLEPIVFSSFNLKALCPRGSHVANKGKLLELVEYAVGISPTHNFDISVLPTYGHVCDHVLALYQARGANSSALRLPPSWPQDGHYKLVEAAGGKVGVVHRTQGVLALHDVDMSVYSLDMCFVDENYSEQNAKLKQAGVLQVLHLVRYVQWKRGAEPSAGLPCAKRLAEDGGWERPSWGRSESASSLAAGSSRAAGSQTGDSQSAKESFTATGRSSPASSGKGKGSGAAKMAAKQELAAEAAGGEEAATPTEGDAEGGVAEAVCEATAVKREQEANAGEIIDQHHQAQRFDDSAFAPPAPEGEAEE